MSPKTKQTATTRSSVSSESSEQRSRFGSITATAFCCLIAAAVARIHLRVETTMIGYEIGQLKKTELQLLEDRANLKMKLAQLTTRKHLNLVSNQNQPVAAATLASTEQGDSETKTR